MCHMREGLEGFKTGGNLFIMKRIMRSRGGKLKLMDPEARTPGRECKAPKSSPSAKQPKMERSVEHEDASTKPQSTEKTNAK